MNYPRECALCLICRTAVRSDGQCGSNEREWARRVRELLNGKIISLTRCALSEAMMVLWVDRQADEFQQSSAMDDPRLDCRIDKPRGQALDGQLAIEEHLHRH